MIISYTIWNPLLDQHACRMVAVCCLNTIQGISNYTFYSRALKAVKRAQCCACYYFEMSLCSITKLLQFVEELMFAHYHAHNSCRSIIDIFLLQAAAASERADVPLQKCKTASLNLTRMLRTDCFGWTRLALHIPSSS